MFADKAWVEFVADFGHAKKFFPDADVFPSVLVVRKPVPGTAPVETQVCVIPRDDVPEKALDEAVAKATYPLPRAYFAASPWAIEPPAVAHLLNKLKSTGTPLKSIVKRLPVNGIKTGLNEAFLVVPDEAERLIAEHSGCRSIIKPYLRGQDIKRWGSYEKTQCMILLQSSSDHSWPWSQETDEQRAEERFRKTFPSLHARMKRYESYTDPKTGKIRGLRHREDQGRFWWELRPCAYYDLFSKPKLIYQAIQFHSRYTFEEAEVYGNNKTYFLESDDLALLAVLNSPLLWWFGWRHFIHMKDEALSNDQVKIAELPIAKEALGKPIAALSRKVLSLSSELAAAHRSTIDWLLHEFEIAKPGRELAEASCLDADNFVSVVRDTLPKKRKLTAAEIGELKREHAATIEPARRARAEVRDLESKISDAVNAAYKLTAEEVKLMWATAPPRMPLASGGDGQVEEEDDSDD